MAKAKKTWRYGDVKVAAHTKSEARAIVKRQLNLPRLPVGAVVSVVDDVVK